MLFTVLTSSAVGLAGLLIAAPAPVDALVAPGSGSELGHLAARRLAGVSPNHQALARRKSNAHKKRQRCQQRPVSAPSTPAPQPEQSSTDNNSGTNNYVGGDDSNSSNNNLINLPSNPTTTTTTAQPAPTENYTPPPAAGGNGKLMLAWPEWFDDKSKLTQFFTGKTSCYYNWRATKSEGVPDGFTFCPMLWGWKNLQEFKDNVVGKRDYSDCVLGMNEVNQGDQANMGVADGVAMWNENIVPLRDFGYKYFVSPATTSAPNGLDWIMEFLARPDLLMQPNVIAVHWYDVKLEDFKAYVENFHSKTNKDIWITEFACQNFNGGAQCTDDYIWYFIKESVKWMDNTGWIGKYAPFGFLHNMQNVNYANQLMNWDTPNDKGYFFIHG